MNLVKFIINDLPFSINDSLEVIRVLKSDLSAIFLSLKLKLKVQAENLGVVSKAFGLLLETSVGESLPEADTLNNHGVCDGATGDLLDTDIVLVEIIADRHDSVNHHLTKELLVLGNNLGV